MYRERQILTVMGIDGWNEAVAVAEEINKLCASKGWTQGTVLTRTVGRFNELSFEFEFPDLTTYERERKEWMAEPGIGDLMRRIDAIPTVGQDPGYSELWEEAELVPD
jgi:hypothetical protein